MTMLKEVTPEIQSLVNTDLAEAEKRVLATTSLEEIHKRLSSRHDPKFRDKDGRYIGPKTRKETHSIQGVLFTFSEPLTRAEAIAWIEANNV